MVKYCLNNVERKKLRFSLERNRFSLERKKLGKSFGGTAGTVKEMWKDGRYWHYRGQLLNEVGLQTLMKKGQLPRP